MATVCKKFDELSGREIYEILKARAAAEGYTAICLDAQAQTRGFYEKCGYRAVSEPFLEAGIPHVRMRRELSV